MSARVVSRTELEEAINTLADAIGVYGHRESNPVSITFGNGITIEDSSGNRSGGVNKVVDAILLLQLRSIVEPRT